MTSVYCFSGSGHSYAIAEYFARELQVPVVNIDRRLAEAHCQADLAVVIFPVYCQNIPAVVRDFFSKLDSKHVVLIATYGKISHGNVLWEAFKIIRGRVIAAAYVPMGHTYLDSSTQFDAQPLQPIFARIQHPRAATLTRESKHPLASFFPSWRSRCGVRIWLDESCNACNLCTEQCPMQAIEAGIIHGNCIRCLRCVCQCPKSALHFQLHPILKRYLEQTPCEDTKVYL